MLYLPCVGFLDMYYKTNRNKTAKI